MLRKTTMLLSILFLAVFLFNPGESAAVNLCEPNETTMTWNSTSSTATINQTTCALFIEVPINASFTNQYVFFEISFPAGSFPSDPDFLPLLVGQNDTVPRVKLDSGKLKQDCKWFDTNGLINRKSYHNLLIKPQDVPTVGKLVFGIYKAYTTSQYLGTFNYQATLTLSFTPLCPRSCSGQGTCNSDGDCVCNRSYFDEDCSVQGTELVLNKNTRQDIDPYAWGYYFFNIGDFGDDLKISLQKEEGNINYAFLINEKTDFTIPNSLQNSGKYTLSSATTQGYLLIQEDNLTPRKNDVLLVGAYNDRGLPTTVQVKFETYSDSSLIRTISIYIVVAISAILLLVWIGISALKYKSHNEMEALLRAYQVEREEDKVLTKKDINKYFPKEKFKSLKTTFSQTLCSVCLEDFEPETVCRQLYCEHIFHNGCIEAWLNQHYNCPNCKKDITKAAIEEFLKEKGQKEEKGALMLDKMDDLKAVPGQLSPTDDGTKNIVGITPKQMHIQKFNREGASERGEQEEERKQEESPESVRTKRRELSIKGGQSTESLRRDRNLQQPPSHEDVRNRNLERMNSQKESYLGSSHDHLIIQNETGMRVQNLKRNNHHGNGGTAQPNIESDIHAVRLEG